MTSSTQEDIDKITFIKELLYAAINSQQMHSPAFKCALNTHTFMLAVREGDVALLMMRDVRVLKCDAAPTVKEL